MTWLFSKALMQDFKNSRSLPGQAGEFSAVSCSDGEPSAQLNVMPTQHKFWRNDKTMEFSDLSRFGLTCAVLTESHGAELLTWFLEGFPAKTSHSLARERESAAQGLACGHTCGESFAKFDPGKSMWRIAQHSLFEDWESSLATWPRWGLMRNGECFHVTTLAEFTYENVSGLKLPTPRACTAMAARITPNTAAAKHPNLETVLARLILPTIVANEGKGSSKRRYIGSPDFRGGKMSEALRTCEQDPIYLNPLFAELVMMWPLGWTDLKPLETDKFPEWLQQHGACLAAHQLRENPNTQTRQQG